MEVSIESSSKDQTPRDVKKSPISLEDIRETQDGAQHVAEASSVGVQRFSQPVCIIVLGMAGTGKTTLINRLTSHLYSQGTPPYVLNLDPACKEVPYPANIGESFSIITLVYM